MNEAFLLLLLLHSYNGLAFCLKQRVLLGYKAINNQCKNKKNLAQGQHVLH